MRQAPKKDNIMDMPNIKCVRLRWPLPHLWIPETALISTYLYELKTKQRPGTNVWRPAELFSEREIPADWMYTDYSGWLTSGKHMRRTWYTVYRGESKVRLIKNSIPRDNHVSANSGNQLLRCFCIPWLHTLWLERQAIGTRPMTRIWIHCIERKLEIHDNT